MPESRRRKKPASDADAVTTQRTGPRASPTWWAPVMAGLMILGLIWIVVFYITQQQYPIPGLGLWNMGIGFAIAMAGFLMTTRWR